MVEDPLDEIEFRTVVEINSRVLGLMNGDFHGTDGYLPQDQVKRLRDSDNVTVDEQESMRIFYSIIHNGRFADERSELPQGAQSYSFDYDGFINDILSGSVARDPVPLPNNMWGAPKDVKGYTYDLDKAKEYLAKVEGDIPEITLGALAGYGQTEQAAALLQNGLNKIGVKTKIVAEPWPSPPARCGMKSRCTICCSCGNPPTTPTRTIGWARCMPATRSARGTTSWYCNEEVDKLLSEARDLDRSGTCVRANYEKANKMLMEDAAGIYVYNTKWFGPFNKKVKGVRFSPIGNGQEMRWVSMTE